MSTKHYRLDLKKLVQASRKLIKGGFEIAAPQSLLTSAYGLICQGLGTGITFLASLHFLRGMFAENDLE